MILGQVVLTFLVAIRFSRSVFSNTVAESKLALEAKVQAATSGRSTYNLALK